MGCLTWFLELVFSQLLLETVWEWLSSFSWQRRPEVPERKKQPRPNARKRISRGGRR